MARSSDNLGVPIVSLQACADWMTGLLGNLCSSAGVQLVGSLGHPNKMGEGMRRWMLVALAVVLAGCAQAATDRGHAAGGDPTSGRVAPAPRTVTVTARANRRVLLAIRDRLELRFPPTTDTTWRLGTWPLGSLSLQSRDDRTGHWTFVARAVGSGHVVLRPAGVCMPPRLCPVAADAPIDGVHARIPGRGGIISIAVFVR
jgi:hypothetical protein